MQEIHGIIETVKKNFYKIYQKHPQGIFFAPGRINFIGEHIDYNGGKVLPFAIHRGTYLAISLDDTSSAVHLYSEADPEEKIHTISIHQNLERFRNQKSWISYPAGVIFALKQQGFFLPGLSLYYFSNLPIGSGLSSSASLEVVTAFAILSFLKTKLHIDRVELALMCQQVENQFVGVPCGIMDQFAVTMGKKDHLILLDTHTLEFAYIPVKLHNVLFVVIDTKKPRNLVSSKYSERRQECQVALERIKEVAPINHLVEAEESHIAVLEDETLKRRVRHVISENRRVIKVVEVLKQEKSHGEILQTLGELLYESHASLRDNYDVSCIELDTIVEESKKIPGVYGARMTGAGFGGSALALISQNALDNYQQILNENYRKKIGWEPDIFPVSISDGVRML